MLHNERQRVLHRGLMCPFDHSRRCRATAHNVDTDFTGENAKSSPATVWSVAASPSQSAPPAPEHPSAPDHARPGKTHGPPESAPATGQPPPSKRGPAIRCRR
jgi:hypothetical protein